MNRFEDAYKLSKEHTFTAEDWQTPQWEQIKNANSDIKQQIMSGVPVERIRELGHLISTLPEDAEFHRQVKRIFDQRLKSIESGTEIDWGTAEALAFASLIQDGYNVRISGQDVERGTFSHRHAHVFY